MLSREHPHDLRGLRKIRDPQTDPIIPLIIRHPRIIPAPLPSPSGSNFQIQSDGIPNRQRRPRTRSMRRSRTVRQKNRPRRQRRQNQQHPQAISADMLFHRFPVPPVVVPQTSPARHQRQNPWPDPSAPSRKRHRPGVPMAAIRTRFSFPHESPHRTMYSALENVHGRKLVPQMQTHVLFARRRGG